VDKYVIMPNRIHLLLQITEERAIRESPLQQEDEAPSQKRTRSLLDIAIGFLKMNSSKQIHIHRPDLTVWQRSYHDHVIRNENDYREIWNYIDTNPARWRDDCFYKQ
jgi:REP element-mobilizing transposase RayT